MGIVGDRPESGLRIDVARARVGDRGDAAPWSYEGHVTTPDARFAIRATVGATGDVTVTLDQGAPDAGDLAEKVKLILRAAYKHAQSEQSEGEGIAAPPRRIQRWRAG